MVQNFLFLIHQAPSELLPSSAKKSDQKGYIGLAGKSKTVISRLEILVHLSIERVVANVSYWSKTFSFKWPFITTAPYFPPSRF